MTRIHSRSRGDLFRVIAGDQASDGGDSRHPKKHMKRRQRKLPPKTSHNRRLHVAGGSAALPLHICATAPKHLFTMRDVCAFSSPSSSRRSSTAAFHPESAAVIIHEDRRRWCAIDAPINFFLHELFRAKAHAEIPIKNINFFFFFFETVKATLKSLKSGWN